MSLHQVCTRVVTAVLQPQPPESAHRRVCSHTESVAGLLQWSRRAPNLSRVSSCFKPSIIVSTNQVSSPVGILASCTVSQNRGCRADVTDVQCTNSSRSPLQCSTESNILRQYKSKVRTLQKSKVQGNN